MIACAVLVPASSVMATGRDGASSSASGPSTGRSGTSSGSSSGTSSAAARSASDSCDNSFLGLKPWHAGLCSGGELVAVCEKDSGCPTPHVSLRVFVWRVMLNVLFDITLLIGYIAAAMVIYGGYMFMMSQGDPTRAAKGKKTLTSAVIGMVISIGASVFVNTIIKILSITPSAGWEQNVDKFTQMSAIQGIFNWAYVAAGMVAVGFLIKSGIDYMISTGDPGKTKKATHSIIYSIVGLVVVILAAVITGFIINAIGGAM